MNSPSPQSRPASLKLPMMKQTLRRVQFVTPRARVVRHALVSANGMALAVTEQG